MKKVGVFGGSFDPIHLGHIGVAKEALKQLGLAEIWFLIAYQPNLKEPLKADFYSRVDMVELAISGEKNLKVLTIEKDLSQPSYTIQSIIKLKELYPIFEFTFLIGTDQAEQLEQWYKIAELRNLVTFKTIARGIDKNADIKIDPTLYPQSSTAVRLGVVEYVKPSVWQYILKHQLYLQDIVASKISKRRFIHTVAVVKTALDFALAHDIDSHQTYLAALFHDIAKDMDFEVMQNYLTTIEKLSDEQIWHQYVGAKLCMEYYKFNDQAIYQAIYHHATGDYDSPLAKIIFCADKIEPTRPYPTKDLFILCLDDLDAGFQAIKKSNALYLAKEREHLSDSK